MPLVIHQVLSESANSLVKNPEQTLVCLLSGRGEMEASVPSTDILLSLGFFECSTWNQCYDFSVISPLF